MRLINLLIGSAFLLTACVNQPIKPDDPKYQMQKSDTATKTTKRSAKVDSGFATDYQRALDNMRSGNHAEAKAQLLALHKDQSSLTGPIINLGILHLKEKDFASAEKHFREALKHDPASAVAYNHLGLILREQGKFAEAEQAYATALQNNPEYRLAHRNIGILYDLYLQQPNKALQHYQRCQALHTVPDKELTAWISDLERQIKAGGQ